jgi:hypothetical protein
MQREVAVVHLKSSYVSPVVERFIAVLKDEAGPALADVPASG